MDGLRASRHSAQKDKTLHQLLCSQMASTSKTAAYNGRLWSFSGDSDGWFYSSLIDDENESLGYHTSHGWRGDFNLSSEISSICTSGSRCIATSFGPDSQILYLPLDSESQAIRIIRIHPRVAHDIWTSDLQGSRLVLGASQQAVILNDTDQTGFQILKTNSDVLAVTQSENVVYTGSRDGNVLRFDTRLATSKGQSLLGDLFSSKTNSVTNLKVFRDWQLLVTNIDGNMATFDLRFPQGKTPLLTCSGHVNSYITKTPLAIDPSEDFVFAAGQDRRLRVWSLRTGGDPLYPDRSPPFASSSGAGERNLFDNIFDSPINALQVSEARDGICLWVTSHTDLYQYHLGQRTTT
ncbi:hypothetical protein BV22DRAFT_1031392 [Leucogyrophana mollusca]|uniref:Uncharacterized protein n=1 Tax=Leucogyrophana mollusca TaxID=85980 RepID=A0ACB8BQW2_9AGAM|nr:hypothetical protein BV22DRAFT_1031392 [Leucogyrophana mollusca]